MTYIYRFNGISYVPQWGDQDSGVKSYKDTVAIGKGEFKHHSYGGNFFYLYRSKKIKNHWANKKFIPLREYKTGRSLLCTSKFQVFYM